MAQESDKGERRDRRMPWFAHAWSLVALAIAVGFLVLLSLGKRTAKKLAPPPRRR